MPWEYNTCSSYYASSFVMPWEYNEVFLHSLILQRSDAHCEVLLVVTWAESLSASAVETVSAVSGKY